MVLYRLIERILAKAFELDPEARVQLAAIEETFIGIEVSGESGGIKLLAVLRVHAGNVEVSSPHGLEPDIRIAGNASGVLRYLASWFRDDPDASRHVTLGGDVAKLEPIIAVLNGLDPDWEEPIAERFGDVPARHAGSLVRTIAGWVREARPRVHDAAVEFLQYESGAVPARSEWEEHTVRLAELSRRLDELERRLGRS